jgi:hypothetical protein
MINIPETELMAEKLGMIVLCENCGKRLIRKSVARIGYYHHEENETFWCAEKGGFRASARLGPLAREYDREPK